MTKAGSTCEAYLLRAREVTPELGYDLGVHPHPSGIARRGEVHRARTLLLQAALQDALAALSETGLSEHERVDRRVLEGWCVSEGYEADSGRQADELLSFGDALDGLVPLAYFSCCSVEERRVAASALLRSWSEQSGEMLERLSGPARGGVLLELRRSAARLSYLEVYPELWPDPRGRAALTEICGEASAVLRAYRERLRREVLPRARSGGMSLGARAFAPLLAREGLVGAQELARVALSELRAAEAEVAARGAQVPSSAASEASRARAMGDVPYRINQLQFRLSNWIVRSPQVDPGVSVAAVPRPWRSERSAGAYYYAAGAYSPAPEAYLFPMPIKAAEATGLRPYLDHVAAHEAYPGHHLHFVLSRESSCLLRQVNNSAVSVEGWATYAEELAHEVSELHGDQVTSAQDGFYRAFERSQLAAAAVFELILHAGAVSEAEQLELLRTLNDDPSLELVDLAELSRLRVQPASPLRASCQVIPGRSGHGRRGRSRPDRHSRLKRVGCLSVHGRRECSRERAASRLRTRP